MSTNFRNYLTAGIGTSTTTVYNPTTAGIQSTVIGLILSNISSAPVTATVTLTKDGTTVSIIKNATIAVGNALDVAGSGSRIVVSQSDILSVSSSAASSIDVTVSAVEVLQ